jgi:hypothetical protein
VATRGDLLLQFRNPQLCLRVLPLLRSSLSIAFFAHTNSLEALLLNAVVAREEIGMCSICTAYTNCHSACGLEGVRLINAMV